MYTIAQTHETATKHLELLKTALAALLELQAHNYYSPGHYQGEIHSIKYDIETIESFLAV